MMIKSESEFYEWLIEFLDSFGYELEIELEGHEYLFEVLDNTNTFDSTYDMVEQMCEVLELELPDINDGTTFRELWEMLYADD